jgi:hypothetical protein
MYVQLFAAGWQSMSAAHALSAVRLWRTLYRGERNIVIICVRRVCERLSCLASRKHQVPAGQCCMCVWMRDGGIAFVCICGSLCAVVLCLVKLLYDTLSPQHIMLLSVGQVSPLLAQWYSRV